MPSAYGDSLFSFAWRAGPHAPALVDGGDWWENEGRATLQSEILPDDLLEDFQRVAGSETDDGRAT